MYGRAHQDLEHIYIYIYLGMIFTVFSKRRTTGELQNVAPPPPLLPQVDNGKRKTTFNTGLGPFPRKTLWSYVLVIVGFHIIASNLSGDVIAGTRNTIIVA